MSAIPVIDSIVQDKTELVVNESATVTINYHDDDDGHIDSFTGLVQDAAGNSANAQITFTRVEQLTATLTEDAGSGNYIVTPVSSTPNQSVFTVQRIA